VYHNPKKNFSLRVSATHLCPSKTVHISRSPISGVLFPRQEGGHEIILTRRERGFGNFSLEEARDEVMFLPPILLGLDQIHLAFCHHVVDGPQIAEVLFLHKPRLDRVLTFLHIIRNIVVVGHGFGVSDPSPVQKQDSPL